MNSTTGKPIWGRNVVFLYRADFSGAGVQAYCAFDENNVCVFITNPGMNYLTVLENVMLSLHLNPCKMV